MKTLLHLMAVVAGFKCTSCGYEMPFHSDVCPYNPRNLR